jgi:hypothetical protein
VISEISAEQVTALVPEDLASRCFDQIHRHEFPSRPQIRGQ